RASRLLCVVLNDDRPDPAGLVVPRVGNVVPGGGSLPWLVLDDAGVEHPGVSDFLRFMAASDYRPSSLRSYALALFRWVRFLHAIGVEWDRARREDARDFVLWMRAATPARLGSQRTSGSVNARTGKRYLGGTFAPATINHNLAVVSVFYDHHLGQGTGP